MKRAKLLAHDWSSDYLATAYAIEKLFFCKMVYRFEIIDEEYDEELKPARAKMEERCQKVGE